MNREQLIEAIETAVLDHWVQEGYGLRPCEIAEHLGVTTQKITRLLVPANIIPVTIDFTSFPKDYPNCVMLSREIQVTAYEPGSRLVRTTIKNLRRRSS